MSGSHSAAAETEPMRKPQLQNEGKRVNENKAEHAGSDVL